MRKFVWIAWLIISAIGPIAAAGASPTAVRAAETGEQVMSSGVVRKIDAEAAKITLKHGPIASLGMDQGMTMVFAVQDPSEIKDLKVGDKVQFQAERVNGQITVTKIEKTK